jgi:homoserine kinase
MKEVTVRVPASTTNLGPGFDALGMALKLYNRTQLRLSDVRLQARGIAVHVEGEGVTSLERGRDNLVYKAVERLYREVGSTPPEVTIRLNNTIPVSRGLGSSSTAIVAGLVGANELLGNPLDREALLRLAVELEGHPDNVAPALLGGFQVTTVDKDGLFHLRVPTPKDLRAVVCVPNVAVSTNAARRVMPQTYSKEDAVFNIGRVALLVGGIVTGETHILHAAMQDRIHQPYRTPLIPGFQKVVDAAVEAGALGASLSGSGSTMVALTRGKEEAVGEAMVAAVRSVGANARWMALEIDQEGAVIETPG